VIFLERTDKQGGVERPLLLSVLDRINKQAMNFFKSISTSFLRQLPGQQGFREDRQASASLRLAMLARPCLSVLGGINKHASCQGQQGQFLERTDKQASVLGRRTKDSSTKKGYPKIALPH